MDLPLLAAHARALVTALEAPTIRNPAYAPSYSAAYAACEALYRMAPAGAAWPKLPAPLLPASAVPTVKVKRRAPYGSLLRRPAPRYTTHAGAVALAQWVSDMSQPPIVRAYNDTLGTFNERARALHKLQVAWRKVQPSSAILEARLALLHAFDHAALARAAALEAGANPAPLPPHPFRTPPK